MFIYTYFENIKARYILTLITLPLTVVERPLITHLTKVNSSYIEGSAFNVSCKATGKPDADVRWIHNGRVKSSGIKTAHLTLRAISKGDAGIYTCRANNSAGITQKQLELVVNCEYGK